MDPNHRHELEENDLAVFLANSKKLWGKYGTALLLTLVVLLGGWWLYNHFSKKAEDAKTKASRELAEATSPDTCYKLAQQQGDAGYKMRAYLKGAEMSLTKAWQADPAGSPSFTEADRQNALKDAETGYQGILDIPATDLALKLNARLGLATVAESRHQWDAAGKFYQETEQAAGDKYPAIAAQAKAKAARLPELEKALAYGPDPVEQLPFLPTTWPSTTMPTSMSAPGAIGFPGSSGFPEFPGSPAATQPAGGVTPGATSAPSTSAHP